MLAQPAAKAERQIRCFAHGSKVGADVDGVGDKAQPHQRQQQPSRQHAPQTVAQPLARPRPTRALASCVATISG
jgi:hypothetical protein